MTGSVIDLQRRRLEKELSKVRADNTRLRLQNTRLKNTLTLAYESLIGINKDLDALVKGAKRRDSGGLAGLFGQAKKLKERVEK